MSDPRPWETIGHRVAIGGFVRDGAGRALVDTTVVLQALSAAGVVPREGAEAVASQVCWLRRATTVTRLDGRYFFVDLAPGVYRLDVAAANGAAARARAVVTRLADGRVASTVVDLVVEKSAGDRNPRRPTIG